MTRTNPISLPRGGRMALAVVLLAAAVAWTAGCCRREARIREAPSLEEVAAGIDSTEALRGEALNLASTCEEPGIRRLGERADEHMRLARRYLEARKLDAAAAEAAQARTIYREMSEMCAR